MSELYINNDMTFSKASDDTRLLKLQSLTTEFVTSVILNHEKKFYQIVTGVNDELKEEILETTNEKIIEMITLTTNTYFNKLYCQIQDNTINDESKLILDMSVYADYGPHILLDKLVRLVIDIHHDVVREQLSAEDLDTYLKTVLVQINQYFLSTNLLHVLLKGPNDDTPFCVIPRGQVAFNITSKIVHEK